MLSLFCKLPVQPQDTIAGMRAGFMARLMLSILQFRINSRYSTTACPPFISIEMDHSDSAREGCTVSTLTVTAEPKDWKQAIEVRLTCRVHVFQSITSAFSLLPRVLPVQIDKNKAGELCQKVALVHMCVARLGLLIALLVTQHILVVMHAAALSVLLILCLCVC